MLSKIENPPKTRTMEHTSINGPPFPTTSKSRIRYFSSRGRLISPAEKMGASWVPWILAQHPYSEGPNISKPTGQAQVSSHEHGLESQPESQLVNYSITAKAYEIYCLDTSFPSWLSSSERWPANNFFANPSQLKNTSSHESRR